MKNGMKKDKNDNLRPFVKGHPKYGGKPKGYVSPKNALLKALNKDNVAEMAKSMIELAKSGSISANKFIYEICNEYTPNQPQINIQNNNISIPDEIMQRAQELAANKYFNKQIDSNKNEIIEISSSPVTSSLNISLPQKVSRILE